MIAKKIYSFVIACLIFTSSLLPTHAVANGYSWYCKRTTDHTQPQIGSDIAFAEKYGGYAIDRAHGDSSSEKMVYLTFDAGYENGNVAKILDTLNAQNVKGAFFVLGNLIENNTDLVNRMFDEGHLVCNHTFSHKCMVGLEFDDFKAELERLENACLKKTGKEITKLYRPPEGRFDENSLKYAERLGYKTVFWSFAYADWDNGKQMSRESAKKKILDNIHNGAIILLHPTSKTNADIMEDIIIELKLQGYTFGTLDNLCM